MVGSPGPPPALSQAMDLLQAIFYAWRETNLRWKLYSYEPRKTGPGLDVSMHKAGQYSKDSNENVFAKFPDLQGLSLAGKAILAYNGCEDPPCFMHNTVEKVFDRLLAENVVTKVEEVRVYIRLTKKYVFEFYEGVRNDCGEPDHTLYRLETRSGDQFAVDFSGAQYGIFDGPIIPWHEYLDSYVEEVLDILDYGACLMRLSSGNEYEHIFVRARDMDAAIQDWCQQKEVGLGDVAMMGPGREFKIAQTEICQALTEGVRNGIRKRTAGLGTDIM
ncbi:hypothetical protein CKM354_000674500 [Cercospora kikuchii]|uniref:Uncharacterized protein n=1 Tax=Cercospora kikuchii TaxID=84275 RepID=A0A9P3CJY6_9PEZI|nr:uncharacterized protein CKM354_000674500 [Cercospora kikuchii]GIZ43521.1 hypothetical protein CKM354_000674500 [Cercospora kikuchii]